MGYPTLTFQSEDSIAIIALTVPEKRNAVSTQMITDLLAALEQAQESPVRVLIITGAGKSFCAGMDTRRAEFHGESKPSQGTLKIQTPREALLSSVRLSKTCDRCRERRCHRGWLWNCHACRFHSCRSRGEIRLPGSGHRLHSRYSICLPASSNR